MCNWTGTYAPDSPEKKRYEEFRPLSPHMGKKMVGDNSVACVLIRDHADTAKAIKCNKVKHDKVLMYILIDDFWTSVFNMNEQQ